MGDGTAEYFGWPLPIVARRRQDRIEQGPSPMPGHLGVIEIHVGGDMVSSDTRSSVYAGDEVLVLDGRFVGKGTRYYEIAVEPGRHVIEVQGNRVAHAAIESEAGERVALAAVSIDRVRTFRRSGYLVGRPSSAEWTASAPEDDDDDVSWVSFAIIGGVVGWCLLGGLLDLPEWLVFGAPLLLLFVYLVRKAMRPPKTGPEDELRESWDFSLGRSEEAPLCDGPARLFGCQDEFLAGTLPGSTGLVIDFDLVKHRAGEATRYQWIDSDRARSEIPPEAKVANYIEAPKAWLEGCELPASWGTWFYPLPAGTHRLEFEVDGDFCPRPLRPHGSRDVTVRRSAKITLEEGEVMTIYATAHVYKEKDAERGACFSVTPKLDLA
jgi:hypothetical protein